MSPPACRMGWHELCLELTGSTGLAFFPGQQTSQLCINSMADSLLVENSVPYPRISQ